VRCVQSFGSAAGATGEVQLFRRGSQLSAAARPQRHPAVVPAVRPSTAQRRSRHLLLSPADYRTTTRQLLGRIAGMMRYIVPDVARSVVCVSGPLVSAAKRLNRSMHRLRGPTYVGPRNHVLDGSAHQRYQANTTERFMHGGDVALCYITFTIY